MRRAGASNDWLSADRVGQAARQAVAAWAMAADGVRGLEADAEPARLRVTFQFAGRRHYEDPVQARSDAMA
jgi:hypothetical protein